MSTQQMVVEAVMALVVSLCAMTQIVLDACRHLQYCGIDLTDVCLQMDLVAHVMIMVAQGQSIVDVADNCRVGDACKQTVASSDVGLQRGVGIDVVLDERQLTIVDVLSDGSQIVTHVGLQYAG